MAADLVTTSRPIWRAWFDGATEPNPGRRGIGAVLVSPTGERFEISQDIGHGTNNEAEYEALIAVLTEAVDHPIDHLVVAGDSLLVINQVNGTWDCKSPNLKTLCTSARALLKLLRQMNPGSRVELVWIPREDNTDADALSVAALGSARESAEAAAAWTNPTDIGKRLGLSAIAVGKKLIALGYREGKMPTPLAIEAGIARVTEDHFGRHVAWHREKTIEALR